MSEELQQQINRLQGQIVQVDQDIVGHKQALTDILNNQPRLRSDLNNPVDAEVTRTVEGVQHLIDQLTSTRITLRRELIVAQRQQAQLEMMTQPRLDILLPTFHGRPGESFTHFYDDWEHKATVK